MATETGENKYKKYGQPSLDLVFTGEKKSLTDRVGNVAVEFLRTQDTQSTYVKSDGIIGYAATDVARFDHDPVTGESLGLLIEESRTNSITYSENFSSWIIADLTRQFNQETAPDGTFTATKITEGGGPGAKIIYKAFTSTLTVGVPVTLSLFVKAGERFRVIVSDAQNSNEGGYFNLNTLETSVFAGSPTLAISDAGNGWKRCSVTYSPTSTTAQPRFYIVNDSGAVNYTGDGTSGLYIWGAQLETGSFPTSYIPTTPTFTSRASTATYYDQNGIVSIAATDVARDDAYFPDENGNFISAGLLLEEAGTNLVTYSEEFDNAAWTKTNLTVSANATNSPDSTATADKIVESATTGRHEVYVVNVPNTTSGSTYTLSVSAKVSERSVLKLFFNSDGYPQANFNLSTGVVSYSNNATASISQLPNGWYRCSMTGVNSNTPLAAAYIGIQTSATADALDTYTGDGTSGLFIWGAQLEEESYATSYIPTTSGISTRAADISSSGISTRGADVAQITGAGFSSFYNQSEGSLFSQYVPSGGYGSITIWDGNGSRLNYWEVNAKSTAGGVFGFQTRSNQGTNTGTFNKGRIEDSTNYGFVIKHAAAIADNDFACYTSSSSGDTDLNTGSTIPATGGYLAPLVDRLTLTDNLTGVMRLSRLTYWPKRLPDSDLQRLTE